MGFYRARNCMTLFLAVLPVLCRGLSPPGCIGTDGQYYSVGDPMPSTSPCEVDCMCKGFDERECSVMDCAMPLCENPIYIEGKCCPVCSCEQNGVIYNPGDAMQSDNPCEASCVCGEAGQRVCAMMSCLQCEHSIVVDGKCCPQCGCEQNGQFYNIGEVLNHDPCHPCTCQTNGEVTCENIQCPKLTCRYHVVPKGECCPVCQCRQRKKQYLPGEIVQNVTCKPLVCQSNGSIKAEPVKCPDLQLQCVDPVIPKGMCCPQCKNGPTCAYGKYIIPYGEDKEVGSKICRCGGHPWFPNAFCTEKKVSEKLLNEFGKYLAHYKP